uniref:Radial spoke head protein 9 homolog n=1 Tax=Salvator merianae TaxID=96440 RepID=A0A8D0BIB8_SALMN
MDAETLPYALDLVAGSGVCLSPEKRAALRNSLQLVRRDYRFEQVRLWGRIQGIRGAYYIAEGLGPDRAGARSRLYSLNCVDWSLLPPPTEEMVATTSALKGRFQGDPSYEYEHTEKKEEIERPYEEETGPLIKEEIRLVATVDQIDKAVGIVPRGAYVKSPLGPVHENRTFEVLGQKKKGTKKPGGQETRNLEETFEEGGKPTCNEQRFGNKIYVLCILIFLKKQEQCLGSTTLWASYNLSHPIPEGLGGGCRNKKV